MLALSGIKLNYFTLIDDGVTLLNAHGTLLNSFRFSDTGRYIPLYSAFHWLLLSVFPAEPWSFSLANGVFLVLGAWQVQRLARILGGAQAGIVAAWLFVLNLSTVENIFTLSKAEPKQLVFWLAALMILERALRPEHDRLTPFEAPAMFFCTTATVLFKETGVLLWAPLGAFGVMTWRSWTILETPDRRRRLRLLAAAALPLAASTTLVLARGLRAGSYAREHVMGGSPGLWLLQPRLPTHDAILASLLVAGLIAGLYLVTNAGAGRALSGLLAVQLVAFVGFFVAIRGLMLYYYLAGVALAVVLLSAALLNPENRGRVRRTLAWIVVLFLIVCGLGRTVAGASALAGWSSLYESLTRAVVAGRPPRVFFHRAGSWEAHVEAQLVWGLLHGVPLTVGVLDTDPELLVAAVTRRDLRPGDWIMEQFGTTKNARLPFRDLGATRPIEHALINPAGGTLLPIRLVHDDRARFPVFPPGLVPFRSSRTHIRWRVYEVTAAPRLILEGVDDDYWMQESAKVWVRAGEREPVTLRFAPYIYAPPGGTYHNQLMVYAGGELRVDCPVTSGGVNRCTFDPSAAAPPVGVDGWNLLELRAANVFSPKELGLSQDTRRFSFNFGPTWERGVPGLFDAGDASARRDPPAPPRARSPR